MLPIIRWFSRNHVAANFLMLALLVGGIVGWSTQRKEIFPETSIDAINISVRYQNATPEEMVTGVVIPIEEGIAEVDGIRRVNSTAVEGFANIVVEIKEGFSLRDVMDDLKTRVDSVDNLAENAERPEYEELLIRAEVMSVAISADTDEATLRRLAEELRDGLIDQDGITQVRITGVRDYEISIEIAEDMLRSHGLTLAGVADSVRQASVDLPGGSLRSEAGEILIRAGARKYTGAEFEQIEILSRADGTTLLLGEIAEVNDGFREEDLEARFNGRPAVVLKVYRVGDEDTLDVAAATRKHLEIARQRLPEGVTLEVWNDQSDFLAARLSLLQRNAGFGFLLVCIALTLFLRPSLAFFVAIGIPTSFAGAFLLMPMLGVSINMISLFAFIMVLGIVVDDALVTGESVYTRMQAGEHPREAAWKGTHEVGVVITFGVLTTVVAFSPMLMLSGVSGKIWPNIPLVVIPTLLFSLILCFCVLPAHLATLRPYRKEDDRTPMGRFLHGVEVGLYRFVDGIYQPLLALAARHRYTTISIFVSMLLLIGGAIGAGWIKTQFFPELEADLLACNLTMPQSVAFEDTDAAIRQIERGSRLLGERFTDREGNPVVRNMLATSGTQPFQTGFALDGRPSNNLGQVTLELSPAAGRDVLAADLAAAWRELTGPIPGAVDVTFATLSDQGGSAIDLQIHSNNRDDIQAAVDHVKEKLGEYAGVVDIADTNIEGKREMRLTGLTAEGRAVGLTLAQVATQLRQAFFGEEVQRLQRGRDEVRVMVRLPQDERRTLGDLEEIRIRTSDGLEVPLPLVAEFELGRGFSSLQRSDRRPAVTITADVDRRVEGANTNEIVRDLQQNVLDRLPELFPGVGWSFQGEQSDQREAMEELAFYGMLALLAIYVLLAIPLRSYLQPLIVMSVIPFGVVGAVLGHVLFRLELSIMSMCGIVALSGMVVNSALIMVDYVNRMRAEGLNLHDAALAAGRARFRPVFLTAVTTTAGLAPMVFETDLQAQFLLPMAVALASGIVFATVITLFLVPSVYLVLEDLRTLIYKPEKVQEMEEAFRREHSEDSNRHPIVPLANGKATEGA